MTDETERKPMKPFFVCLMLVVTAPTLAAGQPNPPPPKPPPPRHLHIMFTGVLIYKDIPNGIRVILPDLLAQSHTAYVRFRTSDLDETAPTKFNVSDSKDCSLDGPHRFAPLVSDKLTLEPATALQGSLKLGTALDYVISMSALVPREGHGFNSDYERTVAAGGKAAAQFEFKRGTLTPVAAGKAHIWKFKTKSGEYLPNKELCAAEGILLDLEIEPSRKTIDLVSSQGKKLTLKLHDGRATRVTIGNSLFSDLPCPTRDPAESDLDEHFAHQYKMVRPEPNKKFLPEKTQVECQLPKASGQKDLTLTYGGSNCIGSQWP